MVISANHQSRWRGRHMSYTPDGLLTSLTDPKG